ncbi:hypothetical protein BC830DRAFT_1141893 [Chytriomyces sp. MP71]|nr:hypothetical protein BC830DRAFT_1141893 [Chytriomyces sp. MP71]
MEPCIMNLPHEVLQQILKLVHPKRVTKFKRVCKFWRAVLSDSYFAQLNLKCFAPLGHGSSVDPAPSGAVRCSAPNEFDQLWILLPATYQQFYATSERMQALETIEWYLDCYFIHPIRFRRNPLPIPPAISLLANSLKQLILSSHSFVDKSIYGGEIPLELAHLVHLQVLNLARNSFRGPIQSEIFKRLTRLEELDLSHNKLSGQLPETLFSLKRLRVLNLNANSLEGQIPLEIGALQSLRFLSIESNKLTGLDNHIHRPLTQSNHTRNYTCIHWEVVCVTKASFGR